MFKAFGDSITYYLAATDAAHGWVSLLSTALSTPITNAAVSGSMFVDQTPAVYSTNPAAGDKFTIMLGTNDERIYGVDATKLGYYQRGMEALIAYLATPTKHKALDGSVTYTGTWGATQVYGLGENSNVQGSTATFNVTGSTVYLGMIQQDNAAGQFTVTIDGVNMGSFTTQTSGLANPNTGISYGPMLLRFPGLTNTAHTVVITVTSSSAAGSRVYLDWYGSNAQAGYSDVYVVNTPHAEAYTAGGSDANVDSYNAALASIVSDLQADGLHVHLVDISNLLSKTTDFDGAYHPVNSGHAKIEQAVYAAITGGITYSPIQVYQGSDGYFYLGNSASSPKIVTA